MIGTSNIHPTAIIHESAIIGRNNEIGAFVVIHSGVELGDNNYISPHVIIGEPPEHREEFWNREGIIRIGDDNVIRENVVIQKPIGKMTGIGNGNFLMAGTHIAHDCLVGNKNNLSAKVTLGGHVVIENLANLGMGSIIHQKLRVSSLAMIGMGTVVTRDVAAGTLNYGVPSRCHGWNLVGLERSGFDSSLIINTIPPNHKVEQEILVFVESVLSGNL
jgi:UDP-N-acetylglucosamine acyltransferase